MFDPEDTQHKNAIHGARLFLMYDKTGYAITRDYWAGKLRYFKFGCEHKYRNISLEEAIDRNLPRPARCLHIGECEKCNHILSTDSSD
jgi:hypothetical protein